MSPNVFECPFCAGQFRVPSHTSHERMLCPHCRQIVELRGSEPESTPNAGAAHNLPLKPASSSDQSFIIDCPSCSKKFQVLESMRGQHVACPHCRSELQIDLPNGDEASSNEKTKTGLGDLPTDDHPVRGRKETRQGNLDPELEKLLPPKFIVP